MTQTPDMVIKIRNAQVEAQKARRNNQITKQPCAVCGSPETIGHHDDYDLPLRVVWMCRKCHGTHHGKSSGWGRPDSKTRTARYALILDPEEKKEWEAFCSHEHMKLAEMIRAAVKAYIRKEVTK